jgi:ParB-like chromosome segregation protein Spo0J
MMSEPIKLSIELWDVDDIKPYPKNAKKHSKEQIEGLAAAIREYGHDQPIVVDADGIIIKGHGRRLSVIFNRDHHGGPHKAPVIVRRDLSKRQADAARLSDNKLTSTDYDQEVVIEEIRRLLNDEELHVVGFSDKEYEFAIDESELASLDDGAFVENITAAVETQKESNASKEKEIDSSESPVVEALGFKKVSIEQSRIIRGFIGKIEADTGLKGADALIDHIGKVYKSEAA